jgi:hypothetical protein
MASADLGLTPAGRLDSVRVHPYGSLGRKDFRADNQTVRVCFERNWPERVFRFVLGRKETPRATGEKSLPKMWQGRLGRMRALGTKLFRFRLLDLLRRTQRIQGRRRSIERSFRNSEVSSNRWSQV